MTIQFTLRIRPFENWGCGAGLKFSVKKNQKKIYPQYGLKKKYVPGFGVIKKPIPSFDI